MVYLTLGTVFNAASVLRTAVGAIAELPVRLLVTVGPRGDVDAVGPVPDHVHVGRSVPQTHLLEHCKVVVSHAGSGTFLGSLAAGLPQLCLPEGADQLLNAADGARVGAAPTLQPHADRRSDPRRGRHAAAHADLYRCGRRSTRGDRRHALPRRRRGAARSHHCEIQSCRAEGRRNSAARIGT
ncbi:MAG TPA: nucleotide disphospho-sugar-binding domain-containing protein [Mycobacteriales bacterium]|nr:nucleotide disphospho-sugar-binding domain-containing protein [Mycobacteriales bacterium]